MEVATRSFVQAVDVFRPDAETGALRWVCGSADSEPGVGGAASEGLSHAADSAAPVFVEPANDGAGQGEAAVFWPCHQGDACRGVVRFACTDLDEARGAFELWRPDERGELGLAESRYANLERLRQVSQYIKFPRRAGLPGLIWEDRFPRVLGALHESKDFVRVAAARSERMSAALGVPFMRRPPQLDAVLLALSTDASPIARVIEVWAREPESPTLRIVSADYGSLVDLAPIGRGAERRRGEGIAGRVFEDAAPWSTRDLVGVEFPRGDRLVEYGLEFGVGVPVFIGGDLVACVTLFR